PIWVFRRVVGAGVAGIADPIPISVALIRIERKWAVVVIGTETVAVEIEDERIVWTRGTGVTDSIPVLVPLSRIERKWAVVVITTETVAIEIETEWIKWT